MNIPKVKIACDWMGPNGPMINNYAPNILQIASTMNSTKVNDWTNYLTPHVTRMIFKKIRGYEYAPSFDLENSDVFVYEFLMNWRQPIQTMCTPGHGMIEQSYLSNDLIHKIKVFRGYILLEYTCEAFVDHVTFSSMHSYFEYHQIPLNKIIYQTGCSNAAEIYEKWCNHNNIPEDNRMKVIFFEWIEWNLSQYYSNEEQYSPPVDFNLVKKDFMVLNRRYRQHRHNLTKLFYKHKLLEKSYYAMPSHHPDQPHQNWKDHADMSFAQGNGLDSSDIDNIQSMLPLKFDHIQDQNEMVQDQDRQLKHWYNTSLISVVTETNCYLDHISTTEKTFKPIINKHPFIMLASYKSLEYLKKGGYKTFSDFWDESYDNEENTTARIIRVAELCKEISEWSVDKKQEFYYASKEILNYNYDLLRSRYPDNMPNRFWQNLRDKNAV